ncbi:hypothetical protein SAMN04488539_0494 [Corynebacterium timonense]|uniref:Uncharacterized protein n=2 Tax=Corynebacterium timonense TaxID=441500 RepID=A0A1H1MCH6_9CORY|nr:hypothetical protein SAMN04488539_0494 [Corynebacterium timonense]
MTLSIDLAHATFADLEALVEAARVAGVDKRAPLVLEGETVLLTFAPAASAPAATDAGSAAQQLPQLGDAAIRSVVDILTGRQAPPRHS